MLRHVATSCALRVENRWRPAPDFRGIHNFKERALILGSRIMMRPPPIFRRAIFARLANLMIQKIGLVHQRVARAACEVPRLIARLIGTFPKRTG